MKHYTIKYGDNTFDASEYQDAIFNEVECGNHYARSLASYGLLLANSGFEFDIPNKTIKFKTKKKPYKTFFTTNNGFGVISIKNGEYNVDMLYGDLKDINIIIKTVHHIDEP